MTRILASTVNRTRGNENNSNNSTQPGQSTPHCLNRTPSSRTPLPPSEPLPSPPFPLFLPSRTSSDCPRGGTGAPPRLPAAAVPRISPRSSPPGSPCAALPPPAAAPGCCRRGRTKQPSPRAPRRRQEKASRARRSASTWNRPAGTEGTASARPPPLPCAELSSSPRLSGPCGNHFPEGRQWRRERQGGGGGNKKRSSRIS